MTTEEFEKVIKRHETLKEYSQAFKLCLESLNVPEFRTSAAGTGRRLIKSYGYDVLEEKGGKRTLTVPLELNIDWVVDTAISLGYKSLDRGTLSLGFLSSCPCVILGSLLAKQRFGIRKNKDNTTSLVFVAASFASDFKLINALCTNIIEQLSAKYE